MASNYIWRPTKDIVDEANVQNLIQMFKTKDYKDFIRFSIRSLRSFWGRAPEILDIEWFREFDEVLDVSQGIEWSRWYVGGRINASYNVVDRVVKKGFGEKKAFIWVGEDGLEKIMSYSELEDHVKRFSNYLLSMGVKSGDVVSIYMPMMPESIVAMLAAVRIGAIASPIFSGFSPPAVADRLRLAESKVLVTIDGYYRRGKEIILKPQADEAIRLSGTDPKVVVVKRLGVEIPWDDKRDIWYDHVIKEYSKTDYVYEADPNDPALLLFTSGTTGRPKGAVISHIGSIIKPGLEHYINLDIKRKDLLWWITDIGWMMGPWQVFGSQLLEASHLMIEGAIDYPPDRVWSIIERYKVSHLGFAATAARILKSYGLSYVESHDISSLRVFGNTGEPIDPDTWLWIVRDVGQDVRPMINLSGGTEVFGCILLPSVVVELKPSTLWGPAPGVDADVFNEEGVSVRGETGYLVVKKPFPSMTRGLWKDPDRYIETYWSRFRGVWYHGDWAYIDHDGFWYLFGRADDVLKVAGMRIGVAEIEGVLNEHPYIAESACIGVPHKIRGEVVYCFVKSKYGLEVDENRLEIELKELVAKRISKVFIPERIIVVPDLPRTRSGKIMRRILRAILLDQDLGDVSSLENPETIESLKRKIKI